MFFNGRRYTSNQILHFALLYLTESTVRRVIKHINCYPGKISRTIFPSFTPVPSHSEYPHLLRARSAFLYPQFILRTSLHYSRAQKPSMLWFLGPYILSSTLKIPNWVRSVWQYSWQWRLCPDTSRKIVSISLNTVLPYVAKYYRN
jgi:hypothetical protein